MRNLFCLVILTPALFADGRFVSMHGKVQVFENGRWAKAQLSSKLNEQSSVQVGYRSGAVVSLRDGSQLALKQNSVVSFNQLSNDVTKPRSEIFVAQGGVSAFVKKPEGHAKHVFHIRTPSVVVGVRGSFMELTKNGEQHHVMAVESPAFIAQTPTATTTRERLQKAFAVLERAYLMDRDEKRRIERRVREAKAPDDAEAFSAALNPTFETQEIKDSIKGIDNHKILTQELLLRQRNIYTVKSAERKETIRAYLAVRALTMLQLAWAEAAYRAELDAYLVALKSSEKKKSVEETDEEFLTTIGITLIPQGDSASAAADIRGPLFERTYNARAERNFGSGVSAAEQQFLGGNTDSQAGLGNDVQGLYNSINSVTQPSDNGEPTLQKF